MSDTVAEPTGEWFDAMPGWARGQRVTLAVLGVLFAALVFAAPVTWLLLRPAKTSSSVPPPTWNERTFASGDAMRQLERHLKESSWVTYELRGLFNESLWRLGVLQSARVVAGRDGWMFLAETMRWKPELLARTRERRRAILRQALDATRSVGMHLVVVPMADKSMIYPEMAPEGALDPGRAALYDEILADLAAVGIVHLDVRRVLSDRKLRQPDQRLFLRRDTHLALDGQLAVAAALRETLVEQGWAEFVGEDPQIVTLEPAARRAVPDLVRMLGLRCEVGDDGGELSGVVRELMEDKVWRPVFVKDDRGLHYLDVEQPRASVALCGTSFSETLGLQIIGELRTRVDRRCVLPGGGSFGGIRKFVPEVGRAGFAPRILIWEFVARDYQRDWLSAKSLFH